MVPLEQFLCQLGIIGNVLNMDEKMSESLSALMDDEANELELERVLAQVSQDRDLRRSWMRYNVAQQAGQGSQIACLDWDISERVKSSLEVLNATDPESAGTGFQQRMLRPFVSLAVAASVAATVVIGGQQLALIGSKDPYDYGRSVATNASPVGMLNSLGATPVQASYGMQAVPILEPATSRAYQELALQRQRKYMQEHAEQAALNAPQGLIPFARVPQIQE
jgi:sigma-E factor negative regulatory protein RseA